MTPALVSIVLPCHNGGRYLEAAVASCLGQTHEHLELVLVDDGSTAPTADLLERLAASDARVRLLRHARRRGLPAALNTGLDAVGGDYVSWTSDDNEFRPQALARLLAVLTTRPEVGVVYSDYTGIDADGGTLYRSQVEPAEALLICNPVGPCFLFRRELKALGFDPTAFLAEDYDFWLRASMRTRLEPLSEDLYLYREHADSLSGRYGRRRVSQVSDGCLARHLPRLAWATSSQKARARLHLARRAQMRREWMRMHGQLLGAARELAATLRTWPISMSKS